MKANDIRVFIPAKNYQESQAFYETLGFTSEIITDDLLLFSNGDCSFFLQRFYNEELANNLMFQLCVPNIETAFKKINSIKGFDIKYRPIVEESWGKVVYLWGPSGELWHITEFSNQQDSCGVSFNPNPDKI